MIRWQLQVTEKYTPQEIEAAAQLNERVYSNLATRISQALGKNITPEDVFKLMPNLIVQGERTGEGVLNALTGALPKGWTAGDGATAAAMWRGEIKDSFVLLNNINNEKLARDLPYSETVSHSFGQQGKNHIFKEHAKDSKRETGRGQIPITDKDIERIPDIISNYDAMRADLISDTGKPVIAYAKQFDDGVIVYLESTNKERRDFTALSMWKVPALTGAKRALERVSSYPYVRNAEGHSPSTTLNIREHFGENKFSPQNYRQEDDVTLPIGTVLREGMQNLAKLDGIFRYPATKAKDIGRITKAIDPDISLTVQGYIDTETGRIKWSFRMPDGSPAWMFDEGNKVYLDSSNLTSGESRGSALYAIAAAYAHNNNKVFIHDPRGLSPPGFYRRLEMMISSALKYGTTKHLGVGEVFSDPYSYYRYEYPTANYEQFKGLGLDWREGDDVHNLEGMLELAYNIALRDFPFIEHYGFDFTKQQYVDLRTNATVDLEVLKSEIKELPKDRATFNSGGSATAARGIIYKSLLREAERGGLGQVLYKLHGAQPDITAGPPIGKQKAPESLKALLYQTGGIKGSFDPSSFMTALTDAADFSTLIHENGHLLLEGYGRLADLIGGEFLEEQSRIFDWLGIKDRAAWDAMDIEARKPYHEQFAKGFERYLAEGVAPTPELASVFSKIKEWMLSIYKAIESIGAEISPEIRGVFDRLMENSDGISKELDFAQKVNRQSNYDTNGNATFKSGTAYGEREILNFFDSYISGTQPKDGKQMPDVLFRVGDATGFVLGELSKYLPGFENGMGEARISSRTLKHIFDSRPSIAREMLDKLIQRGVAADEVLPNPQNNNRALIVVHNKNAVSNKANKNNDVTVVEVAKTKNGIDVVSSFTAPDRSLKTARELKKKIDNENRNNAPESNGGATVPSSSLEAGVTQQPHPAAEFPKLDDTGASGRIINDTNTIINDTPSLFKAEDVAGVAGKLEEGVAKEVVKDLSPLMDDPLVQATLQDVVSDPNVATLAHDADRASTGAETVKEIVNEAQETGVNKKGMKGQSFGKKRGFLPSLTTPPVRFMLRLHVYEYYDFKSHWVVALVIVGGRLRVD